MTSDGLTDKRKAGKQNQERHGLGGGQMKYFGQIEPFRCLARGWLAAANLRYARAMQTMGQTKLAWRNTREAIVRVQNWTLSPASVGAINTSTVPVCCHMQFGASSHDRDENSVDQNDEAISKPLHSRTHDLNAIIISNRFPEGVRFLTEHFFDTQSLKKRQGKQNLQFQVSRQTKSQNRAC